MEDVKGDGDGKAAPTVSSILGIKGPLRFRRHKASQKAHVVLRRVELSEETSDDENRKSTVYFSLFAQKRIEVKPGKEILLAVASQDGTFTDQAVIFEGDLRDSESSSEGEEATQVAEEEEKPAVAFVHTVPPKMRRTWNKRFEQVSASSERLDTAPPTTSFPSRMSVGVQAQPSFVTTSVQVDPTLKPPHVTASPNATEKHEKSIIHTDIQTDPAAEETAQSTHDFSLDAKQILHDSHSRSLSPMSIGSVSSSGPSSPAPVHEVMRHAENVGFTTIGPGKEGSPQHFNGTHALAGDPKDAPESSSLLSPTVEERRSQSPDIPGLVTSERFTTSTIPSAPNVSVNHSQESTIPTPTTLPTGIVLQPGGESIIKNPLPRRAIVPNPFVSGGFMTEFVGSSGPLTVRRTPGAEGSPQSLQGRQGAQNIDDAPLYTPLENKPLKAYDSSGGTSRSPILGYAPVTKHAPAPPTPSTPSNHHFGRPVPYHPGISTPSLPAVPNHSFNFNSLPPKPLDPPRIPPSRTLNNDITDSKRLSSFGETKNVTSPTVSILNPLGIGPSKPVPSNVTPRVPEPPETIVAPRPQTAKKPLIIGSGWPQTYNTNVPEHVSLAPFTPISSHRIPQGPTPSSPDSTRSSQTPPGLSGAMSDFPSTPQEFMNSNTSQPYNPFAPVSLKIEPNTTHSSAFSTLSRSSTSTDVSSGCNDTLEYVPSAKPVRLSMPLAGVYNLHPRPMQSPITSGISSALSRDFSASSVSPVGRSDRDPPLQSKGKKRTISTTDPEFETRPRKRSFFKWPVQERMTSTRILSDEDPGIRDIKLSSDGKRMSVTCYDRTIRIWSTWTYSEIARLANNSRIISALWMTGDTGVISLAEDGTISTWTQDTQDHWQWCKLLDAGSEEAACFSYTQDRIAVAVPRFGVKVWLMIKGTWQPQRSILRQNVTSIKFVEDGEALLGGTSDGVLWYCQVPNGTLRAYTFLKSKVYGIDILSTGSQALVSQIGGRSHLVGITQDDHKGKIEQVYAIKEGDTPLKHCNDFGATFASRGQTVLFGTMDGYVLIWDKMKGDIIRGLDHGEDEIVQAIASYDRSTHMDDCYLVTGTKQGLLTWWRPPLIDAKVI